MSRYEVDKFLRHVEGSDDEVRAYAADPDGYVETWRRRGAASRLPVPDGGRLEAAEADALRRRDPGALYRLGAHPYLLWHFMEAVWVWTGERSWPDLNEEYRTAVAPAGYPDFGT